MKITKIRTVKPVFLEGSGGAMGINLGESLDIGKSKCAGMTAEFLPGIGIKLSKGSTFTIVFSDNIISASGVNDEAPAPRAVVTPSVVGKPTAATDGPKDS